MSKTNDKNEEIETSAERIKDRATDLSGVFLALAKIAEPAINLSDISGVAAAEEDARYGFARGCLFLSKLMDDIFHEAGGIADAIEADRKSKEKGGDDA